MCEWCYFHLFLFRVNNGCCIQSPAPFLDFNRKCFETKVSASISIIFSYWWYPSPYLSSCLSVYTTSGTLRSSSDGEKNTLSRAKMETLGFGYRSLPVVLCSGPLYLDQPSCWHPTLQFSLTVQIFLLNSFSLLLPTLSYTNQLTLEASLKQKWFTWVSCMTACNATSVC